MDYISMSDAIDTIVRTLETDVLNRVDDTYARSQIWASTGILANIAVDLRGGVPAEPAGAASGETDAAAAEQLLEQVRKTVARQASLHYRKAAAGS